MTSDPSTEKPYEEVIIACEWSNEVLGLVRDAGAGGRSPVLIFSSNDIAELYRFKDLWKHFLEKPDSPILLLLFAFDREPADVIVEFLVEYKKHRTERPMEIKIVGRSSKGILSGFTSRLELSSYKEALRGAGLPEPATIERRHVLPAKEPGH